MPGKCNFNDKWLHLVEYRSWLQKVTENPHKAYCVLCMKQIDIAAMGESALKSHASGLKHKDAEKSCANSSTISTFFSSSGSDADTDKATTSQDTCIPAVLTQASSVQPVMLNSIEPFVVDRNITLTAEIYWVLKVVSNHSFKSSESIKGVFQLMFRTVE